MHIISVYQRKEIYISYLEELRRSLESMHKIAKENLLDKKAKRKDSNGKLSNNWVPLWGDKALLENVATGAGKKYKEYIMVLIK